MDLEKASHLVAERRRSIRMTQVQLAESLGVSDRTVSKWERGISHDQ